MKSTSEPFLADSQIGGSGLSLVTHWSYKEAIGVTVPIHVEANHRPGVADPVDRCRPDTQRIID